MNFLEGIFVIILCSFLLMPIIAVSYYLGSEFKSLSNIDEDLTVENIILAICNQKDDVKTLLNRIIEALNSNEVNWISVELLSDNCGRFTVKNNSFSAGSEEQVRYIRVVKINSKDVLYFIVGVKND
jgi:hypothetical protein